MEYVEEKQPVFDPNFWAKRLAYAFHRQEIHRVIYEGTIDQWNEYEKKHIKTLKQVIKPTDSILDCGCGWGRLIDMLSHVEWKGNYLGLDLSPDLIRIAQFTYPRYLFAVADLLHPIKITAHFDIAVMISIKPMVIRNVGQEAWYKIEHNVSEIAGKILLLEYGEESYELY